MKEHTLKNKDYFCEQIIACKHKYYSNPNKYPPSKFQIKIHPSNVYTLMDTKQFFWDFEVNPPEKWYENIKIIEDPEMSPEIFIMEPLQTKD